MNPLLTRSQSLFINGSFTDGHGEPWTAFDPSTREPLATLATASEGDTRDAVAHAVAAFPAWRDLGGIRRAVFLRKMAAGVQARSEQLIEVQMRNNGKPRFEAEIDVGDAVATFEYYAEMAEDLERKQSTPVHLPDDHYSGRTRHEAVGAVGMIVPWNFPLVTSAWKIAPALAAGCTIVIKTSEYTPLAELVYGDIAAEIGLPAGVLNILTGAAVTGMALTSDKRLAKLSFTGSNAIGSRVMQAASARCQPVSLELGGKSPIVVFDDAPIDSAVAQIVAGIFFNCGQMCSATSRLIVQRSMRDRLMPALVARCQQLQYGSPFTEGVEMGPLSNQPQFTKIAGVFEQAKKEGLNCLVGGELPANGDGWCVPPTIYDDIALDHPFWREELFGPILVVTYFDDEAQAIELANDSDFGLVATIVTADMPRAERLADQIMSGHIWINSPQVIFPQTLWGGFKGSGIGRELGPWGLSAYLGVKHVSTFKG
ncbi:Putative aldehyde dehydrogenase AldA [Ephemeroptericola cinctiostellae]|uniref:Aldehyde dehydrogenase AldA n=1 Tax=Ephemeroptericola cinctiostellae TaxID=2268024 RepID=A0A345D8N1_9BURK|nr:aldehyde dehydrogenase family protein [Ephemeroptericola cinctiostellae]AXF84719.1 Putative aldehyde dehydrogenase AldA [Ephemeroptericola cinctiostellae]